MDDFAAREKLRRTIRRWPLFEPGEKLLVAVSGGIDSVVLLHLLSHLPKPARPRVFAAHFDHRLRGRVSGADLRFVRALSRAWGIPCRTGKAPRWKTRRNIEARARDLRYGFLEAQARRLGVRKIATAHHADDQMETFALRWLQGAGLKGLAGMRRRRVLNGAKPGIEIVRPLWDVTRKEIESYARAFRLPHREDATNRSGLFLRSRLRKLLRTLQRENPNLAERTAVNSVFLQADEDFLAERISSIFRKLARRPLRKGRKVSFPLPSYLSMPDALRYRLLQRLAQESLSETYALPAVAVLKVDEILRDSNPGSRYDLPSGLKLEKGAKSFVFFRKSR